MRISLFSLTGFANEIIPALVRYGVKPSILITREEPGPYPYYEIPHALAVAGKFSIPASVDPADEKCSFGSDLLLVATYHRKVPQELIDSCSLALNLHPSLLPKYPGRNPFAEVLEAGEIETGVTAHKLTQKFDGGEIYDQWHLPILGNESQASLRYRLAKLAAEAVVQIIDRRLRNLS